MSKFKNKDLLILLLLGCFLFLPIAPMLPIPNNLDASWKLVMNYAVVHQLILGKDIVFSYGVFPYLHTYLYTPGLLLPMLLFRLSFIITLLFYLYAFLVHVQQRSLRLILPLWFLTCAMPAYFSDAFYISYGFIFLIYALTHLRFNGWLALGSFLLAVVGLIKFSFTFYTLLIALVLACVDLRYKKIPFKLMTYVMSYALLLVVHHQPLTDFHLFVAGALAYVTGYSPALAMLQNNYFALIMYVLLMFFLWRAFLNLSFFKALSLRYAMGFILAFSIFNMFKEGFVRADHVYFAYGYVLDLSVLLLVLLVAEAKGFKQAFLNKQRWLLVLLIFILHIVCFTYKTLPNPVQNIRNIFNYPHLASQYQADMDAIKAQYPLPSVEGTTDIYSYDQTVLLANNLAYHPRPMFQSLTAFSPKFLMLNRDFLLSDAPQNIFFAVQPTDNRYPSIEDGLSWPVLLAHYDLKSNLGAYAWLIKNNSARKINFSDSGVYQYRVGETVVLPSMLANQYVWAKFTFANSPWMEVVSLLFKPQEVFLVVTLSDGKQFSYRFIPGMVSSGFLFSPLVQTNNDFMQLYQAGARNLLLKTKQIKTFSVYYKGWQAIFADSEYQVQFFRMSFTQH